MVALVLQKSWQCDPVFGDERRLVASDHPFLKAGSPGVASGQKTVPGWRAASGVGVGVGETLGLRAEPIQIRGGDLVVWIVGLNIADSKVVSQNENDIRLLSGVSC